MKQHESAAVEKNFIHDLKILTLTEITTSQPTNNLGIDSNFSIVLSFYCSLQTGTMFHTSLGMMIQLEIYFNELIRVVIANKA